jgi:hypothetical protein
LEPAELLKICRLCLTWLRELQAPASVVMAFHMPGIVFNSGGSSLVFGAGFVLGSLACLIFRLTIDCTHNLRKWGAQDDKVFNMDAAEKGGLKVRTKILLDEDLFSLEKRAFFSQVSHATALQLHHFNPKGDSGDACEQCYSCQSSR